ncbi:hypothetical protein [Streptomyces sp. L2]|uniref:hypothetical protein n=1 Tax=Streptomyces sp. L2 TaxID=2162665 RepID=UPI0010126FD9|nr:hypothetical protein [Streptomyces sp. L2]
MCEGIEWLAGRDEGVDGVVFARDVTAEDLAVRMGGRPGAAVELTGPEVSFLLDRSGTGDNDVVRVAACGAWSYAVLHLADPTSDNPAVLASGGGVEVIHYVAMPDHPPAQFRYMHDGRVLCGFGIGEEAHRWGRDPDILLPVLVAAGVLAPGGSKERAAPAGSVGSSHRLTLSALERHFGLCLPRSSVMGAPLAAYTVRGRLLLGPDSDVEAVRSWAAEHGYPLNWGRSGHVPAAVRDAYAHATGTRSN